MFWALYHPQLLSHSFKGMSRVIYLAAIFECATCFRGLAEKATVSGRICCDYDRDAYQLLEIATRVQSTKLFKESFIHVVGQYTVDPMLKQKIDQLEQPTHPGLLQLVRMYSLRMQQEIVEAMDVISTSIQRNARPQRFYPRVAEVSPDWANKEEEFDQWIVENVTLPLGPKYTIKSGAAGGKETVQVMKALRGAVISPRWNSCTDNLVRMEHDWVKSLLGQRLGVWLENRLITRRTNGELGHWPYPLNTVCDDDDIPWNQTEMEVLHSESD